MARQGFVIYYKDFDDLDELTDVEFRTLFRAMRTYSDTGEIVPLDGQAAMAFRFLRRADDCDRERYEKRVDNGKRYAEKRWQPMGTHSNPCQPINSDGSDSIPIPIPTPTPIPIPIPKPIPKPEQIPNNEEDTGVTGVASAPPRTKTARFVKPSIEEVRAYCKERGNGVDAEQWIDHYEAKGWMIGKNSMKDWRAAVRTWERGDNNGRTQAGRGDSGRPAGGDNLPRTRDIPGQHEF